MVHQNTLSMSAPKTHMDNDELNKQMNERALQWMIDCLKVTRQTTAALMKNDLAAIENCLEEEGRLASQWPEVATTKRPALAEPGDETQRLMLRQSLSALAAEIKTLNYRNAALTESGMEFSRALLDVIRPAATYGPSLTTEAPSYAGPAQSIISVKY